MPPSCRIERETNKGGNDGANGCETACVARGRDDHARHERRIRGDIVGRCRRSLQEPRRRRRCGEDRCRDVAGAVATRRGRARADAFGAHHAGQSRLLQGARPYRADRSEGAADQVPGQSAGRVERALRAVWWRRLQRRAHHGPRAAAGLSLRQAFATRPRLRHLRHPTPATNPSPASRRSSSRSTTKRSRISLIAPTRKCAIPPLR